MKTGLIAVMVVLALIAVDITVRIGWDRFISGIGSLVDGQRHAKRVSPDIAQPRTTPHRTEPPPLAPGEESPDGIVRQYYTDLSRHDIEAARGGARTIRATFPMEGIWPISANLPLFPRALRLLQAAFCCLSGCAPARCSSQVRTADS